MKAEILDPAREELVAAVAYYNRESEGLGYRFAAEVRTTISRIVHHPHAWTPLSQRTRRCRTKGFPYGVVYQIREDRILVVAVMHLHRHPQYWQSRLPEV